MLIRFIKGDRKNRSDSRSSCHRPSHPYPDALRRLWFWQKPFTRSAQTNLNPKAFFYPLVLGLIVTSFGGTSYAKPLIACCMFLRDSKNLSCCSGSGAYLPRERGLKWVLGERQSSSAISGRPTQVASTTKNFLGLYNLTNPELY